MKPICATVDHASDALTADCVSMTSPPNSAVKPPISARPASARGDASITSVNRISRTTPALTTPACKRADTGVGASITSVNQPWVGNCAHLITAVSARNAGAPVSEPPPSPSRAAARTAEICVVP